MTPMTKTVMDLSFVKDPMKRSCLEDALRLVKSTEGLAMLGVFGSVARGTDVKSSDIDLYAEWEGETRDENLFYVKPLNDLLVWLRLVFYGVCDVDLFVDEHDAEGRVKNEQFFENLHHDLVIVYRKNDGTIDQLSDDI